jgi:hypothetical protein
MATAYSFNDEIAVSANVAAQIGLPPSGTAKQAQALKGSHIVIGVSNFSAPSYFDLVTWLHHYGITSTGTNSDVTIDPLGSPPTLTAALAAGKIQAICNTPPVTVVANTYTIQIAQVPPIDSMASEDLVATTSLIQHHPDTIQALVTGTTEGWVYARAHPSEMVNLSTPYFTADGITSPEEIDYLVASQMKMVDAAPTTAITRAGWNIVKEVIDLGAPTPVTSSMTTFIDNTFVDKAITQLGLKIPLGPLKA